MKRLTKYFILMVAMVVGVLTYGTSTFAMTAITPYTNADGETIKWSAPTIAKVCLEETFTSANQGATFLLGTDGLEVGLKETKFDSNINYIQIKVFNTADDEYAGHLYTDISDKGSLDIYKKNGAMYSSKQKYYEVCVDDNFTGNYYVIARVGNNDTREFSEWSSKYYIKTEAEVKTSKYNYIKVKKSDAKKSKVKISWSKFPLATKYTVYCKSSEKGKWYKVGTTKKTSFTLKRLKGKRLNFKNYNYSVKIIPTVKNNKKYHTIDYVNPTRRYYCRL